jgi:cob(I)alamin adenosyltransferase
MVKLNKIYTKTGDDGTTGLATGARVRKDDLRVEAYGTVDESNAAIGVALTYCGQSDTPTDVEKLLADRLRAIQNDLFDVGADLATPVQAPEAPGSRLRVLESQTVRLERLIDEYNEPLAPLTSFVLPGGSAFAAALHVARTVVRRAERLAVSLMDTSRESVNPETVRYLNRLSDLLFVLARVANNGGKSDVLWVPGATRNY